MRWDLVAESALAGALDAGSPGDRYQVAVHVAAETLACSREPAPAALGAISAETRASASTTMQPPDHPAAPGAISAETREFSPAASAPAAPAADLDADQAVIEQAGGIHVGKEVARRVACDAGLVVLRHAADGNVLDVGRRTRTIPTALRRALEDRESQPVPVPRLQLAPLRRPSRRALGRWRRHAARQPGPLLSISSPCGT